LFQGLEDIFSLVIGAYKNWGRYYFTEERKENKAKEGNSPSPKTKEMAK